MRSRSTHVLTTAWATRWRIKDTRSVSGHFQRQRKLGLMMYQLAFGISARSGIRQLQVLRRIKVGGTRSTLESICSAMQRWVISTIFRLTTLMMLTGLLDENELPR